MNIQSHFDTAVYQELCSRLEQLQPDTPRLWGCMTTAQMMWHCRQAYKVPLTSKQLKPHPLSFIARFFAAQLYNNKPYRQSLPTAKHFRARDDKDFATEKAALRSVMQAFYERGAAGVGNKRHPIFGTLTAEQWGQSMWKHLDHHLRQFGV